MLAQRIHLTCGHRAPILRSSGAKYTVAGHSTAIPKGIAPLLGSRRYNNRSLVLVKASEEQPETKQGETATTPAPAADGIEENQEQTLVESSSTVEAVESLPAAVDAATAVAAPSDPAAPSQNPVQTFIYSNPVAYWSLVGIGGFLGVTFVIAVFKTIGKGFSSKGKRTRTVNKNKAVVEEFSKYLPSNRAGLTGAVVGGIRLRTGFSPVELFRKYLWYLLRERKFDQDAVDDLVALKISLNLNDQQVAEALKERSKRVYDKYGNVMLDTSGMSPAGIERKATARALFSKMLYLIESEALLAAEEGATVNLRDIFGATEDDAARLRIASLYEVDLDKMMEMPSAPPSVAEDSGDFNE